MLHLSGYELTCEFLEEKGFDVPIIVNRTDGLDVQVPPSSFTVQDVENYVGRYYYYYTINVVVVVMPSSTPPSPPIDNI